MRCVSCVSHNIPLPLLTLASPTMPQPNEGTLYFGYGSNLWKSQMLSRCPTSEYLGIARLDNYRWIINDRGYANVVSTVNGTTSKEVVWGLVYRLQKSDEEHLDINEGVPVHHPQPQSVRVGC